ncbi:exo-beta-D-glucosaminidase [Abditibacteriota bacterium]|nr:exo-beta-D-glucosaminidase [Abditibacteriota bacterium]
MKTQLFNALRCIYAAFLLAAALSAVPTLALPKTIPPALTYLPLDRNWTLISASERADGGEQIAQDDYAARGWMPALVPGTVLSSYVRNHRFPEPYYDLNNKISSGLIPDASVPGSVFTSPFWYRTTFSLDASYRGKTICLNFDGINYRADIYLNGHQVGTMAGMFKRGVFNVTGQAIVGRNALAVKIYPLDTAGAPHDVGCGGDGQIGKNAATMYASIGWDFTIVDGIRDRNIGIYRKVFVSRTGPVRVYDPFIITKKLGNAHQSSSGPAELSCKAWLSNATDHVQKGTLQFDIEGAAPVTEPVTLAPNETREVTLEASHHPGLLIQHPRLWWPLHQGKPELYALRVSFVMADNAVSDAIQTHFGIRTITQDTSFHGQNTFWVNGQRTFIQGGNWVQDAMLRATRRDYEVKLQQIAQAGVNMVRCWSASAPESDDFYDVCDHLGIMVWTESGAAAQVISTTDTQLQLDNWADVVRRVRNHPCQAYYCGCNEGWPVAGTREVTLQNDATHGYQDSSQQNGQRGAPYRFLGINTLYDYTARDLFGAGPLGPFAGFCNETGTPALPPAEVLREFIPARKLWPVQNNPEFDESIDYHDGGGFHLVRDLVRKGCAWFGSFDTPDPAGRVGLDNYAFKGQMLGAMQYRAFSEVWKRNKWDEKQGRFNTGYMMWTINNANPMAASRLASYSGEPNAALFYFAHGNKPLHTQYDYFAGDVSVINDTRGTRRGLTVTAQVRNLDWSLRWSGTKRLDVGPDQSLNGLLSVPARDADGFGAVHFITLDLRDEKGQLLDRTLYWRARNGPKYGADGRFEALNEMPMARLSVRSSIQSVGTQRVVTVGLANPTPYLAFFTRLKVYRAQSQTLVEPCRYEDNYFSLRPHETRTIRLQFAASDLKGEAPRLIVEGWNIHTLALVPGSSATTSAAPSRYHRPVGQMSPDAVPPSQDKPVTASSTEATNNVAGNVVDGNDTTRWASTIGSDPQWISIDLGEVRDINGVRLNWEAAAGRDFEIQTSLDGQNWTTLKSITGNTTAGVLEYVGLHGRGRYIRIYGTARATQYGYSLYEFQVFGH